MNESLQLNVPDASLLTAIVQGSDDAIFSKDLNGIITSWNEGAERIFGYTEEEMIGRSILTIIPPERHGEETEILRHLRNGERVDHFETVRMTKDGKRIDVAVTASPIFDPSSEIVIGASKIVRDITERKITEKALREAQVRLQAHAEELERTINARTQQLRETIAELEAFCYSLSHDMRTPLRAIQSYSQIVLEDCKDRVGSPGVDYLERIVSASQRMDRLIHDVLAFTHLSRQEIVFEALDVDGLIRELIKERPDWQSPRANITIEAPLLSVIGHRVLLTQCIANYLENAVKFVRQGATPEIRVYSERRGENVRLWFEDKGIGINEDAIPKVFGLFQRTHAGGHYEGAGIGLAIVRRAADRMHGFVGVESEPGVGSRFWVELPGVPS